MALELKQQGNEYVAEAKYEQAADLYTQALAVCDDDAAELRGTLLCNRSHCYIELERFEEAMKDASDSIEARPNWFKPHLRLAEAVVAIDPYKALYEWLSAFALDDRCREADVAVSAIQGLIQPHVHARQDLIKQHSLASLLCCPYTGGLLTQPVTLPSGQLVNKTIAQYYTSPHHDHILPVTEQELFDLDSDNSDVTESHVNLMMRNVMEKVAANQVAHNQAVAELDVLGAVDAYYQAREEKDSDGMRSALGKIHKLIPTVLEHWEQEPTSYIAWCMVLLHELQLVDGGSDKPATWPDMPQPKDLLAQVPTSLASLDIVRSVPNRTQPYHADPGLVNLLGACTTLSDDRIRHFARQLVCTYKIDRNASAIPPDELAAKISEFDMTWLGTMDKLPKEEDLEQALRNIPATDFDCQLCFSMVHYPVALPCGHVFCKTCVERFLDHKPSCPVCRLPLPHYLAKRQFEVVAPLHELTRKLYPEELAQRDEERQAELAEMRAWMPVFVCNTVWGACIPECLRACMTIGPSSHPMQPQWSSCLTGTARCTLSLAYLRAALQANAETSDGNREQGVWHVLPYQ
eukprot:TRINITY_DN12471_c0_g1_i10.p1 TRINITY_DN12471_c0_g1~~TRINITY_DN12471_c0_g1_i10.p1  ORF type:complete len:577 (+),score=115.64 TRINITY_DN12471_c0_g1_i10:96-1826(+)